MSRDTTRPPLTPQRRYELLSMEVWFLEQVMEFCACGKNSAGQIIKEVNSNEALPKRFNISCGVHVENFLEHYNLANSLRYSNLNEETISEMFAPFIRFKDLKNRGVI